MTTIDELEILYKTLEFQPFLSVDEQTDIQTYFSERDELAKSMYTASSLYNHIRSTWRDISTGNSTIDSILLGGFKYGTITEISGRGATGKTQFLMTLCASVQRFNTPTRQSHVQCCSTAGNTRANEELEGFSAEHLCLETSLALRADGTAEGTSSVS